MRVMQRTFQGLVDHPLPVLAVAALLVLLSVRLVPGLLFYASADALVLEGDRSLDYAREIGARYGSEDFLLVTYQPDEELFSDATLARLSALRDELAALDTVSSVVSILDVPLLYSPKVGLSQLGDPLPRLGDGQVDRRQAAQEFLNSPIYKGLLTNADNSVTALQVNFERDEKYFRLLNRREDLRRRDREQKLDGSGRAQLAEAEVSQLAEVLAAAGSRYKSIKPGTWPQQASLAAEDKWDELKALKDRISGGVIVDEAEQDA